MIAPSTAVYRAAGPRTSVAPAGPAAVRLPLPRLSLARAMFVVTVVGGVAVAAFVVVWLIPALPAAARAVRHAHVALLAVAVLAQVASLFAAARLQRSFVAAAGVHVRLLQSLRTTLAATALNSLLPGGSVAAVAYTARRMRAWGATPLLIGYALTVTGLLSAATLAVLAATGGLLGAAFTGTGISWWAAARALGTAAALLSAVIAGARVLTRPQVIRRLGDLVVRALAHRPRRAGRDGDELLERVDAAVVAAQTYGAGMPWARATLFAAVNWIDDMLCLLLTCYALGIDPSPHTLVVGYVAAKAATTAVPLLPGGIGAVEAVLVATLRHAGAAAAAATAAVLVYRLISFGLVSLAGAVALTGPGSRASRGRPAQQPA